MRKKKIKWQDIVLIVLILLLIIVVSTIWYSHIFRALDYVECNERIEAAQPIPEMSREEIIEAVNVLTGTNYKIIWERDVDYSGKVSSIPFDNRVFLDETQSNNNLVWAYTHEILHKKLYSANERFVEFETFKVLYESGIKYFQDVALWRASIMWKGDKEYDCTWYVVQYLDGSDTNVGSKKE